MRKIIWTFLLCLVVTSSPAATLVGYGEVEHCYKEPDESIPLCDGSAYSDWERVEGEFVDNFCYVPSLGCNVPVVTKAIVSYGEAREYASQYETVTSASDCDMYDRNCHVYCQMTYPYLSSYVYYDVLVAGGTAPCTALFAMQDTQSCAQDGYYDDDGCEDWWYISAFRNADQETLFLSALFEKVADGCALGQYVNADTNTCEICPAGTYATAGATECTACPAGMYAYTGSGECTRCTVTPCDVKSGLGWGVLTENEYGLGPDSNCDYYFGTYTGYDFDAQTWWTTCDDIKISGDYVCSSIVADAGVVSVDMPMVDTSEKAGNLNGNCWCKMTAPFEGTYWVSTGYNTLDVPEYAQQNCLGDWWAASCAWRCSRLWNQTIHGDNMEYGYYGYYTDDGLVSYKTSLFSTALPQTPCEIGISRLMLSTGDAFQLWAEKYTEPSLVIQYNDEKCYVKLESGAGKLNINFNGEIYHAVE